MKSCASVGFQVSVLKSLPLRLSATYLTYNSLSFNTCLDWTRIGRLHCILDWWEEATVDFMNSGGYNVTAQIRQILKKTLIIWGKDDQIIDSKLAVVGGGADHYGDGDMDVVREEWLGYAAKFIFK